MPDGRPSLPRLTCSGEHTHAGLACPLPYAGCIEKGIHLLGQVDHAGIRLDAGLVEQRLGLQR